MDEMAWQLVADRISVPAVNNRQSQKKPGF
jgi:hypothetical protein